MKEDRPVLIAAGGTGGHLFPAEALSGALSQRGFAIELATDARALKYGGTFPARAVHRLPAATPTGGSLLSKVRAALVLARGTLAARRLIGKLRPLCVVGFGGYPTVPPVLAAVQLGVPALLHEQNAVMGRANRFLARRVDAIATGFPTLGGSDEKLRAKAVYTGNPVRPAVIEAARIAFPACSDGRLRLLVTGGSQGARIFSDVVPAALELLSPDLRARLNLVQQVRGEDEARVRNVYARLQVVADVAPFFADLPARMAGAHLVVARAGASTVSELAVVGRPAILVPFPFALDQDQAANAAHLAAVGAAEVVRQADFSPQWLAHRLTELSADMAILKGRAEAARSVAVPDAAERLADLVMRMVEPFARAHRLQHSREQYS
jgi:UDP-N-acetylglucosamine--N-acetylmuramyl-(pentapeptide) pyrophosphoryl-undecaprenol N-acetylglucosamine transferase